MGRSAHAALRLLESYVSSQHATIRWVDRAWELRDLGSRNGTFLDGVLLTARTSTPLRLGAQIGFGHVETSAWQFIDDSPPRLMATPLGGDTSPILGTGDLLALPSVDQPLATIYRAPEGSWLIEREDSTATLHNHQQFQVGGIVYRFSSPETVSPTAAAGMLEAYLPGVHELALHFSVSRDEEHVELNVRLREHLTPMGSRGHNYLLLLLARQRLEDRQHGASDAECGWVYQDQLRSWLGVAQEQLNLDIFRIRRQFGALQLRNAAAIIERRPSTRQLRVGTGLLHLEAG